MQGDEEHLGQKAEELTVFPSKGVVGGGAIVGLAGEGAIELQAGGATALTSLLNEVRKQTGEHQELIAGRDFQMHLQQSAGLAACAMKSTASVAGSPPTGWRRAATR